MTWVYFHTFQKDLLHTDSFYVVLLVKDKDRDCLVHKGDINPFKRDESIQIHHNNVKSTLHKGFQESRGYYFCMNLNECFLELVLCPYSLQQIDSLFGLHKDKNVEK